MTQEGKIEKGRQLHLNPPKVFGIFKRKLTGEELSCAMAFLNEAYRIGNEAYEGISKEHP